jgi:hypothetical protein
MGRGFKHIVVECFLEKRLRSFYGEKEKGPQSIYLGCLGEFFLEPMSKIMYKD